MKDAPKVDATHLKNALRNLGGKGAKRAIRKVFTKYLKEIRNRALNKAPERTGVLKNSIRIRFQETRAGHTRGLVVAGNRLYGRKKQREAGNKGAFYAHMQEEGWTDRAGKKHEGKHYLSESLQEVAPKVLEHVSAELDAEIKKGSNG